MSKKTSIILIISGFLVSTISIFGGILLVLIASSPEVTAVIAEYIGADAKMLETIFTSAGFLLISIFPVGIFASIIGAFMLASSLFAENKKIIAEGFSANAKIIAINETNMRRRNQPVIDFILEVYPANQTKFTGKARQEISIIHIPSYQPGKMVEVKYLPGSEKVVIVGVKAV